MFDVQARRQARVLKAQAPENPVAGTFHEALDAYDRFIETDVAQGVAPSTRVQRQSQVKYLKRDRYMDKRMWKEVSELAWRLDG